MSIQDYKDSDKEAWNDFVHANDESTFFHRAEWKDLIEKAFGLRTYYMSFKEGGAIKGVLPLALVKRPLFGPALISNPLCIYGGALGQREELEQAAVQKAEQLGVQYLELRNQTPIQDWETSLAFYSFRHALSMDHDENMSSIHKNRRTEIRKAEKLGLNTVRNQDVDLLYHIHSTSVRNLGTPVFHKKFLQILMSTFRESCEITTIYQGGQPLTSMLSLIYKDQILPYCGGGLPEARGTCAFTLMYWRIMERAVEQGLNIFDFGRSVENTGAFAFKKNFVSDPVQLYYQYHLVKAQAKPDMDPNSARNKLITSIWKKTPLPIANRLGPILYPVIM